MVAELVKQGGMLAIILVAAVTYFLRKEKESTETAKTVAEKLESSYKDRERVIQEANEKRQADATKASEERLRDQELFRETLVDLNAKLISALNLSTTTQEALADTVDTIREKIEGIHTMLTQQATKKRGT